MPNKNRRKSGIKWKLFTSMAIFTVIVITLMWLLEIVFIQDIYNNTKLDEIKNTEKKLAQYTGTPIHLESMADSLSKKNDICIIAYRFDAGGRATKLFDCDVLTNCVIHSIQEGHLLSFRNAAKKANGSCVNFYTLDSKNGEFKTQTSLKNGADPEYIIYSALHTDAQGNDILIICNSLVSPVNTTARTLNGLLIIVSIVMIVLALLFALFLSKIITKPITDISSSAKQLALGNYDIHFKGGSYKEINELSDTLNYASYELSRVDKLRQELIANTSHDLRTPLTMITGYAEVMRDLPDENTPENAQIIIDESKRLTSLVNDMLDISKLENGVSMVKYETFNISEAVNDEIKRYNELFRHEGYVITFEYDQSITVRSDRSKLMQALINLVNNAITYTGDDKLVRVRQDVYEAPDNGKRFLRLSVIDSGEGIPYEKLADIWDRYYKIDSHHRRNVNGSGLGLSIVNKLMTVLGGHCGVLSSNGNGSIFWIEIEI